MSPADSTARTDFLANTGEMGERIRAFDWTRTQLGAIEFWPQSLKTSVSLILSSRHPMWIGWGREMTFLYNDAYLHVLGPAKHPQALGLPASEVWSEIWDVCGPLANKVFTRGEATFVDDVRLFMDRGDFLEETFYSFSYSPIRDDSGAVCGLFCPSTDVTPKVLNGRRLATLSELAGHAPAERTTASACAAIARTLAKNPDDIPFALLYLPDSSGRRASLEQCVGAAPSGSQIPESVSLESDFTTPLPVAGVYRSGERQTVSVRNLDGLPPGVAGQRVVDAAVLPVSSRGEQRPYGVLVIGVNPCRPLDTDHVTFFELVAGQVATAIQSARAVEEEKKRADMLAEIDRVKTAFFSNVSHEFRTPLTLMLGPLENLLAQPDALAPRQLEEIDVAHRNSLRLLKLVNSLLDFSRLEAGRLKSSFAPVDLAAVTGALASNFRSAMQAAGLALLVDCPPLPGPVYVDRDMWEKIVLNLLSNAFKFTLEGQVSIRLRAAGEQVILSVSDTGIGIPDSELPHIFERFHRVEGARGRSIEGSGIGLALIQEYAKQHGGSISVASRSGEGSTFTVSLPFGPAHLPPDRVAGGSAGAPDAPTSRVQAYTEEAIALLRDDPGETAGGESRRAVPTAAAGPKPRILLADDNADMREHVSRILGSDFEVATARDGNEALDLLRRDPPDVLVSDIMMPGLDGFQLLHAVRAHARLRTLPVIFISARAGEEMRIEGLEAGADDYLVKPFTASELRARVGAHARMAIARREAAGREAALRAEAEQARDKAASVLESITDAFVALDRNWRFTYVNAEAERINGMRREQMLGHSIWDFYPDLLGSNFHRQFLRAAAERTPVEFENYYEPFGRWFHIKVYPAPDGGLSSFYEDITERKRIQEALRQQDALRAAEGRKWRELFFQVPAAVALLRGPSHRFEACNDQYVRLVGRGSAEELLQRPIGEIFPELREQGYLEILDRVYYTGEPFEAKEALVRLGTGQAPREVYLNFVYLPTRNDSRQINGIFVHATNVTDLVRARQQVEESEKRFASAFAEAPIGMVLTKPDGTIVEANQAYADMLGRGREELLGQKSSQFTHADDLAATRQFYERLLAENATSAVLEKRCLRKNGEILRVRGTATMRRDADGRAIQVIAIVEDITERKRAEEDLRRANQDLEQFAYSASHDLQEPLRSIKIYGELLTRRYRHKLDGRAAEFCDFMQAGASRMEMLVADLLAYTQVARLEPPASDVDANQILDATIANLRRAIADSGAAVHRDPLPFVRVNSTHLGQLFQNLIGNAIKYRKPDVSPVIHVSAERRDGSWLFSVRDNGIGIDPEYKEHIFGLFKRLHSADEYSGTGIGLAICQRIVERYQGRIWVESEPGDGSTFFFSFPV